MAAAGEEGDDVAVAVGVLADRIWIWSRGRLVEVRVGLGRGRCTRCLGHLCLDSSLALAIAVVASDIAVAAVTAAAGNGWSQVLE